MQLATTTGLSKSELKNDIASICESGRRLIFSHGFFSSDDVLFSLIGTLPGNDAIEIMIATWTLGLKNIIRLKRLCQSRTVDLKILLDVSFMNRKNEYTEELKEMLGSRVWLTKNHSKVMTIQSKSRNYSVLSSANFNRNFRFEFYDITESKERCEQIKIEYAPFFKGNPLATDDRSREKVNDDFDGVFQVPINIDIPKVDIDSILEGVLV